MLGQNLVHNNGGPKPSDKKVLQIRQSYGKSLLISTLFNRNHIEATIDTAAMITLANEKLFTDKDLFGKEIIYLKGLGDQLVTGRLVKGVEIQIGN